MGCIPHFGCSLRCVIGTKTGSTASKESRIGVKRKGIRRDKRGICGEDTLQLANASWLRFTGIYLGCVRPGRLLVFRCF